MAKKITGYIKLQVPAGAANPSPPIGPALGQRGVNIMDFCKAFNAATRAWKRGCRSPPSSPSMRTGLLVRDEDAAGLLLPEEGGAKLKSGSKEPGKIERRPRHPRPAARDRRSEDEGSQRQRHRGRGADHRRLGPRDGPRSDGELDHGEADQEAEDARRALDPTKLYGVDEAITTAKANATAKFDETIEIALNLGVDPRHADQMVRGVVTLPAGTGKDVRVAVFAKGDKADEATKAGADVVGAEDLMETIQGGTIDFDRVIATPDMMGVVGRLGKVLGPKGLMPNPKLGTVTMNVAEAVKAAKGGQVEFRVEKAGIIHSGIGKASFTEADLRRNFDAFVDAIVKAKPTGAKGKYVKKAAISSSMGPGLKLDVAEVAAA